LNKLLACLCSLFSVLTLAGETGVQSDKILLGQSAALSGSSQALGKNLWLGAQAYFDKINEQGGVHGRRIEVITRDDAYEGDKALVNTINLVKKDKVFALFGYVGTPTMVRALPAVRKLNRDEDIFLFGNFTGAQPQRGEPYKDYIFNIRPSYKEETKGLVDHLVRLGHKKIGLFIQFDSYGRSGADGVRAALKEHNLQVIEETTYMRGAKIDKKMSDQVKRLMEAGASAVISIGSYEASTAFIRESRVLGYNAVIANVSFVGSDELLKKLLIEQSELQVDLTQRLLNSQVVPPWSDLSIPLVMEYQKDMKRYFKKENLSGEFNFISLEGYLNAKVFVQILNKNGPKLSRNSFMEKAYSIKSLNIGLSETVNFSSKENQALHEIYYTEYFDGESRIVKDWNRFLPTGPE
tara:strand:+ start:31123 stop:32349 length:1227 start_codon:yes stop_codon:yes gene_type:complete